MGVSNPTGWETGSSAPGCYEYKTHTKNNFGSLAFTTPPYPLHHTPSVRITHYLWPGPAQGVGKGSARPPSRHNTSPGDRAMWSPIQSRIFLLLCDIFHNLLNKINAYLNFILIYIFLFRSST